QSIVSTPRNVPWPEHEPKNLSLPASSEGRAARFPALRQTALATLWLNGEVRVVEKSDATNNPLASWGLCNDRKPTLRKLIMRETIVSNDRVRFVRQQLALILLTIAAGLLLAQPCAATPGEWDFTNSLNVARQSHTATLLPNGQVLAAAGASPYDE